MANDGHTILECDYTIYLIPASFMQFSDVANIYIYDGYDIVEKLFQEEYCIYAIKR